MSGIYSVPQMPLNYGQSVIKFSSVQFRPNVITAHHLAERLRMCREHILFSDESRFASSCSEQLDVPESIDVVINIMPPIVYWNMIPWWSCHGVGRDSV